MFVDNWIVHRKFQITGWIMGTILYFVLFVV